MYSSVEFSDIGPPVSTEDLTLFEALLGEPLPESYRSFLLTINGGRPYPQHFPIVDNPAASYGILDHFFALNADSPSDLKDLADMAETYFGRVPADLLPIATDPNGNLLCLTVRGVEYGVVYFWDSTDAPPIEEPPSNDNLYLVANDFYELLEVLEDLDEEDEVDELHDSSAQDAGDLT